MARPARPLDHVLEPLRRQPASTVIACDFDGTLSAIVDDPDAARPVEGAVEALAALADRSVVAVISGRPVSFLQRWFPDTIELHGLYGLESVFHGVRRDHPDSADWQSVVDAAVATSLAGAPEGVLVEPKGRSFTFHFRTSPEQAPEALAYAEGVAASSGLALRPGRMSVELYPPVEVDKGTVLRQVATGRSAACFIGDDAGDLTAFDALDALAAEGVSAVRIAVRSPEAPPGLLERADVIVNGPTEVVKLLHSLRSA